MTISTRPVELRDILGMQVADYSEREALSFVHACIEQKRYQPVAFLNANNANITWTNPAAARAFQQFIVLSDGIGVDMAARLLYGKTFKANLNGTDFVPMLLKSAVHPLKIGLLGAAPGIAEKALDGFADIDERHDYRLVSHGFFGEAQEAEFLDALRHWRPDILLVALGVPRQELWISNKLTSDHCTVPVAVGALLDFVAGNAPRAPMWVRAIRCEWVYRLLFEPARLWRRYLLGNPIFLGRALYQKWAGGKRRTST
ncbi:MAG: WecB/TagA/CpsF family glycosyltransferase [Pseudomonadota bacterium]